MVSSETANERRSRLLTPINGESACHGNGSTIGFTVDSPEQGAAFHAAGLANGGFVVVWESEGQDGSGYGIYAQRYGADGVATGDEFQVNSLTDYGQSRPEVAADAVGGHDALAG